MLSRLLKLIQTPQNQPAAPTGHTGQSSPAPYRQRSYPPQQRAYKSVAGHPQRLLMQVDGTPGIGRGWAGLGVVVRDTRGHILCWTSGQAPAKTNNEAEYQALILGLRFLSARFPASTTYCLTDCKLIVDQMAGVAACRAPSIRDLHSQALVLIHKTDLIFVHVPREANRLADALAWDALSGRARLLSALRTTNPTSQMQTPMETPNA